MTTTTRRPAPSWPDFLVARKESLSHPGKPVYMICNPNWPDYGPPYMTVAAYELDAWTTHPKDIIAEYIDGRMTNF